MLNKGLIRPSQSDYTSPILIIIVWLNKKVGDFRLCVDHRNLNKITVRDNFPLPHIDDLLSKLTGKRYFTALDLKSDFHHVLVEEEFIKYTSFVTQERQFEYTHMPFELTNTTSVFQRYINRIYNDIIQKNIMQIYVHGWHFNRNR